MQIEWFAAKVRVRSQWEAVDLGFAFVRRWWQPLALSWCGLVTPIALAANLACWRNPIWLLLPIWWLAPFHSRIALFILSRALFGAAPRFVQLLRELPTLLGAEWWRVLTIERLDPARTLKAPVVILEGMRGFLARQRAILLSRDGFGEALFTAFVGSCFQGTLIMSALALTWMIVPSYLNGLNGGSLVERVNAGEGLPILWKQVLFWAAFFALGFAETLFAAVGFALYLNRRTRLEGWDLELTFRRLALRWRRSGGGAARLSASVLVVLALTLGTVAVAEVPATDTKASEEESAPHRAVREILQGPDFHQEMKVKRWSWRGSNANDAGDQADLLRLVGASFAAVLRPVAFALVVVAVLMIAYTLVHRSARFELDASVESTGRPATILGLDVSPESLPRDLVAQAQRLWDQGDAAAALGLLYRGALSRLLEFGKVPLGKASTEGDCVRSVQRAVGGPLAHDFQSLTRAWQRTAYAHRPPSALDWIDLVEGYRRHFESS